MKIKLCIGYFLIVFNYADNYKLKYYVETNSDIKNATLFIDATNKETNVVLENVQANIDYFDKQNHKIGSDKVFFTDKTVRSLNDNKIYSKIYHFKNDNVFYVRGTSLKCDMETLGGQVMAPKKDSEILCLRNEIKYQGKANVPHYDIIQNIENGATIAMSYNQPSVKGRAIGLNLEPFPGKVWRAGANEATTFAINKDVKIDDKALPAGRYSLFVINENNDNWTIVFNKEANIWGTDYQQNNDMLRVQAKFSLAKRYEEKLRFLIDEKGIVTLLWGNYNISFKVN